MISRILSLIAFCLAMILATPRAAAQELNCTVEIDVSSLSSNQQVFETLREAVNEYMNNTKFTTAQFSPNEKIECRLFLTVKEYTDDVVKGDVLYHYAHQLQGQQDRVHLPRKRALGVLRNHHGEQPHGHPQLLCLPDSGH